MPVVRLIEGEEIPEGKVAQLIAEINDRQWSAVLSVLVEAKYKAESMLRNDQIFADPGRVAYFTGWVCYADYILSSLHGLRNPEFAERPGPEPGPE